MKKNISPICPRCGKEPAIVDMTYGILPGDKCQEEDEKGVAVEAPEFYNATKQHRIQDQRDKHNADITQPWLPGKDPKPNPDFVKLYPDAAKNYFTDDQLSKM